MKIILIEKGVGDRLDGAFNFLLRKEFVVKQDSRNWRLFVASLEVKHRNIMHFVCLAKDMAGGPVGWLKATRLREVKMGQCDGEKVERKCCIFAKSLLFGVGL